MPYIQTNNINALIYNKETDLAHLAATTLGYTSSALVPDFWIGWGGDLATAMSDVSKLQSAQTDKTAYELAIEVIGSKSYSCSRLDIENDIDAIKLSNMLKSDTVGNSFDNYFQTVDGDTRRNIFLNSLGFTDIPTVDELNETIYDMMTLDSGFFNPLGIALQKKADYPDDEIVRAVTLAFSNYILNTL